ncbi:MAG: T9SS type A sorting domain-containing protein [Gemmatimonadetes bacterium]|jgi:enediyne biosynthesis protein E4|nr:T9SS type A sorting domain-containing protein [Gemmatimonadota bacterium]
MTASTSRHLGALFCAIYFTILLVGPSDGQTVFMDVTDQADISRRIQGRATTFGDYDNDGWPDLFIAETNRLRLYHNEGDGIFAEGNAAIQAEISPKEKGSGALFGDYDNDGDLDLFVPFGNFSSLQREMNMLLRNDRGVFVNVAEEAGLTDALPTDNAIWLDYDRDGHIDLYTGNLAFQPDDPTVRNKLYRNEGDGTFTDATEAAGLNIELHPRFGGTHGGMAAGDFNDDGWPDLYVAVFGDRNRLFLNDGAGGFVDVTTNQIGDPGEVSGIAVGDINNDGDLEIFQGAGRSSGSEDIPFRSLLLLNLGEGAFLDVTESVGLPGLTSNPAGVNMADVDNDGDLDLLTASPHFLFLNDGNGVFADSTAFSGIGGRVAFTVSFASYDLDGFLDVVFGAGGLWRNRGNGNHWLRVELVGVESNRNGIGARLLATSGALQQMREMLGGLGYNQDELVAHFGMGSHTLVDELEIRWPSGRVDVLTDVPADQKIRVIEGRGEWYPTPSTVWTVEPPQQMIYGREVNFVTEVRPALFEPRAEITSVTADLSSLGGLEAVSLEDLGDGTYRLETRFAVGGSAELRDVEVFIEQVTPLGPHWIKLSRNIEVVGEPNTAVTESFETTRPLNFILAQNYPNPFNSDTVIRFALPTTADVDLAIYNLAGQLVATLVEGVREAGTYTVNWDGRDNDGRALASGVYLYRLQTDSRQSVETRKLLLLR